MDHYVSKEQLAYLDVLQETNYQLLIKLGRRENEEENRKIQKIITRNSKFIKKLRNQQEKEFLIRQQQQMRELLQQTQQVLSELQQKQAKLKGQSKQLAEQREQCLKILSDIDKGFQATNWKKKLTKQLQNIIQIDRNLNEKQIVDQLDGLNYVKKNILDNKRKIDEEGNELKNEIELMQKSLNVIREEEKQLANEKQQLQVQLSKINGQNANQIIKKKQEEVQVNPSPKQNQIANFKIKKCTVEKLQIRGNNPSLLKYQIWGFVLIIWLMVILYWEVLPKINSSTKLL